MTGEGYPLKTRDMGLIGCYLEWFQECFLVCILIFFFFFVDLGFLAFCWGLRVISGLGRLSGHCCFFLFYSGLL